MIVHIRKNVWLWCLCASTISSPRLHDMLQASLWVATAVGGQEGALSTQRLQLGAVVGRGGGSLLPLPHVSPEQNKTGDAQ